MRDSHNIRLQWSHIAEDQIPCAGCLRVDDTDRSQRGWTTTYVPPQRKPVHLLERVRLVYLGMEYFWIEGPKKMEP